MLKIGFKQARRAKIDSILLALAKSKAMRALNFPRFTRAYFCVNLFSHAQFPSFVIFSRLCFRVVQFACLVRVCSVRKLFLRLPRSLENRCSVVVCCPPHAADLCI